MPESRHRRRRGRALPRTARSAGAVGDLRPRKKVNKLYLAASALIAILVIAGFAIGGVVGGGGGSQATFGVGSSTEYLTGVGVQQDMISRDHVDTGQTVEYTSFPPTSGDHWSEENLVSCGFYEGGLRDEIAVHHMEHGNIVVSYNLADPGQVENLRQLVDDIDLAEDWGVTRSYDKIPEGQVALSTWEVVDTFDGVDEDRIRTFFNSYAGNLGPEFVPCVSGISSMN